MHFMTLPVLMVGDDILLPMPELSGDCTVQLGCCCQHLTAT